MHSVPPTSTASLSPAAIDRAPRVRAFSDDAQALFTVKAGTESGTPAGVRALRGLIRSPPRLPRVPEDRLVDRGRGQTRPLDRRPRGHLSQVGGAHRSKAATELADGGSGSA